jgi:subtilisin family serine protease
MAFFFLSLKKIFMRKKILSLGLYALSVSVSIQISAQVIPGTLNWYNKEGAGMATDKAYGLFKKKKSEPVIVAVIDSGVDIEHEDLQGKIWVNTKEIPNNKIDDDKNGYVDDVHGWNFLGNAKGENLDAARFEKTRILAKLMDKYDGIDPATIKSDEEFELYQAVKNDIESERAQYEPYLEMIKSGALDADTKKYIEDQLNYNLNVNFDDRSLIGDNPDDFNDTNYGNPDVEGPDALHGTHVSGIICAIRGNNKGGDGVADNVKIMSLRAVPNGDEHDKDIALAIRYAVDNGAKIINMSFGKSYSPHQKKVFEAFEYADSKGVLLVHAAGNDAKDIDIEPNFPTSMYSFQEKPLDHFLTIGASTKDKEALVASFSNYGQMGVDVFAPGFEIYNTVPQSAYQNLQGTSMAAPMVAGVAAMLKSYFPTLTMKEIKDAILSTVVKYTVDEFATKSVTGGVVNVYNAVKACQKLESARK